MKRGKKKKGNNRNRLKGEPDVRISKDFKATTINMFKDLKKVPYRMTEYFNRQTETLKTKPSGGTRTVRYNI